MRTLEEQKKIVESRGVDGWLSHDEVLDLIQNLGEAKEENNRRREAWRLLQKSHDILHKACEKMEANSDHWQAESERLEQENKRLRKRVEKAVQDFDYTAPEIAVRLLKEALKENK